MSRKKKTTDDFAKAVLGERDADTVAVLKSLLAEGFHVQYSNTRVVLMKPDTDEAAVMEIYPAGRSSLIERAKLDEAPPGKMTVSDYLEKRKPAP